MKIALGVHPAAEARVIVRNFAEGAVTVFVTLQCEHGQVSMQLDNEDAAALAESIANARHYQLSREFYRKEF